ncbi:omwaprin-c-like [Hyperolius riggenbachi]|uniref:omwaprin-c-like n=1 Tax=Hyperolius riggenbachi TaxID=752182 RepID=UPI0035A2EDD1
MRAAALLLVLGLVLLQVAADSSEPNDGEETDGDCPVFPPTWDMFTNKPCPSINTEACEEHKNCDGDQKCCRYNCENYCTPPVKSTRPGFCAPPSMEELQSCRKMDTSSCSSDDECEGTWKCCPRPCGNSCSPVMYS